MFKKLTTLLLVVCMLVTAAGCSMFASDDGAGKGDESKSGTEDQGVKITDTFTHQDPTDIEFDERRILEYPKENDYVTTMNDQLDVKATAAYMIIYAKDKKVVGHYEYIVCEDEEHAEKLTKIQSDYVQNVKTEGNVSYFSKTGDALESEIASNISMNMMADDTIESYINFFVGSFAAVEK